MQDVCIISVEDASSLTNSRNPLSLKLIYFSKLLRQERKCVKVGIDTAIYYTYPSANKDIRVGLVGIKGKERDEDRRFERY